MESLADAPEEFVGCAPRRRERLAVGKGPSEGTGRIALGTRRVREDTPSAALDAWQAPPAERRGIKVTKAKKPSPIVTTNRRDASDRRKTENERRAANVAVAGERRNVSERREKVNRRRQIDPTTCERDYTD